MSSGGVLAESPALVTPAAAAPSAPCLPALCFSADDPFSVDPFSVDPFSVEPAAPPLGAAVTPFHPACPFEGSATAATLTPDAGSDGGSAPAATSARPLRYRDDASMGTQMSRRAAAATSEAGGLPTQGAEAVVSSGQPSADN